MECRVFWWNIKSPRWLSPLTAQIWLFPKLKSPLKGKRFQTINEIQEKYDGAADGRWENCVRSQGTYFEGDWGTIVLCTMFLVSWVFFNKCLCFSYYMAGYLLDRPHVHLYILFIHGLNHIENQRINSYAHTHVRRGREKRNMCANKKVHWGNKPRHTGQDFLLQQLS